MRLVIDSNVWISALVFGGAPRQAFTQALHSGDSIITCPELYTEVQKTINNKFPEFLNYYDKFVRLVSTFTDEVRLGSVTIKAVRDPKDDYLLELAVIAKADIIISGDKDLLTLDVFQGVKIIAPSEYLSIIEKKQL
jgi:uncharacterized protein